MLQLALGAAHEVEQELAGARLLGRIDPEAHAAAGHAAEHDEAADRRPEELARLASPYAVDNLEGLAATRGARGETLLWLISDDNFNPLQRNILMLFELAR